MDESQMSNGLEWVSRRSHGLVNLEIHVIRGYLEAASQRNGRWLDELRLEYEQMRKVQVGV